MGHEIDVEEIIEPDEIIWENLAYTGSEQRIRQLFTVLFALFFIGFSVVFTMATFGLDRLTEQEIPERECLGKKTEKIDAYLDIIKKYNLNNNEKNEKYFSNG